MALLENSFAEDLGANGVTMIGMDERVPSSITWKNRKPKRDSGLRFWLLHLTAHSLVI